MPLPELTFAPLTTERWADLGVPSLFAHTGFVEVARPTAARMVRRYTVE